MLPSNTAYFDFRLRIAHEAGCPSDPNILTLGYNLSSESKGEGAQVLDNEQHMATLRSSFEKIRFSCHPTPYQTKKAQDLYVHVSLINTQLGGPMVTTKSARNSGAKSGKSTGKSSSDVSVYS